MNPADLLINPAHTISIAEDFFKKHDPNLAKEDWVKANAILINKIGAEEWLNELLDALSGHGNELQNNAINPYHATEFHLNLKDIQPTIDTKVWIEANKKLLNEIGDNNWLWSLVDVLEAGKLA